VIARTMGPKLPIVSFADPPLTIWPVLPIVSFYMPL
jgi:hypothetical protein